MTQPQPTTQRATRGTPPRKRSAFTLVELLIVISIIALLATVGVIALRDARLTAQRARARSQVTRISEMIMTRWEEYESRQIPMPVNSGLQPQQAMFLRYHMLKDLMRMELPDRITDVQDPPIPDPVAGTSLTPPPLWVRYNQYVVQNGGFANWSVSNQGAECLYMILQSMDSVLGKGTDFLLPNEIGDTDRDGFYEVLDPWGNPVHFLRWAPGFRSPLQEHPVNGGPAPEHPDPFDPFRQSPRWKLDSFPSNQDRPFALTPLIVSAGPDGRLGVITDFEDAGFSRGHFAHSEIPGGPDPYFYYQDSSGAYQADAPWAYPQSGSMYIQMGWRAIPTSGRTDYGDNIDNHFGVNQ